RLLLVQCDSLIVHSDSLRRQLVGIYRLRGREVSTVPHGVSPASVAPESRGPRDGPVTLLFYGTIRENKGLHHLLDCFEQLPSDWRIVIAGSIAEADYYEREVSPRIQRLMAAQRSVHLSIGFVPEESVAALFAAADLLVLPYFGFEAQSGVLLDAVAHRTPVVVTAAGAMADTVRASGIGVVAA